jgi:hypothetical protein
MRLLSAIDIEPLDRRRYWRRRAYRSSRYGLIGGLVVSGIELGWSMPNEPRWPVVERLFIDPPLYKKHIYYNTIDENLGINQGKYLAFAMILTRQRPKAGVS